MTQTTPPATPTPPTASKWTPLTLTRYWKAVAAFIVPGLGGFLTANADGHVTLNEWVYIVIFTLASSGIVAAVPQKQ